MLQMPSRFFQYFLGKDRGGFVRPHRASSKSLKFALRFSRLRVRRMNDVTNRAYNADCRRRKRMERAHVLVDYGRGRQRKKRGASPLKVPLQDGDFAAEARVEEILALDESLNRLEGIDPRQSRIVELRYFGGLSVEEIAEVLGVSAKTVKRDWRMARAWLYGQLREHRGRN